MEQGPTVAAAVAAVRGSDLPPVVRWVWMCLVGMAGPDLAEPFEFTLAELIEVTGHSRRSVQRGLAALGAAGWIKVEHRSGAPSMAQLTGSFLGTRVRETPPPVPQRHPNPSQRGTPPAEVDYSTFVRGFVADLARVLDQPVAPPEGTLETELRHLFERAPQTTLDAAQFVTHSEHPAACAARERDGRRAMMTVVLWAPRFAGLWRAAHEE